MIIFSNLIEYQMAPPVTGAAANITGKGGTNIGSQAPGMKPPKMITPMMKKKPPTPAMGSGVKPGMNMPQTM